MSDRLIFPPELGLSPTEVQLAALLVSRERVSRAVAYAVLYDRRTAKPQANNVKVYICNLRKKFATKDLRIDTVWGWGWRMPPADRERLRTMLKPASVETVS